MLGITTYTARRSFSKATSSNLVDAFEYRCSPPFDPAKKHCTPDHDEMRGYLFVTK